MMSQDTITIMANFDVITFVYIDAIGAKGYRGMPYIAENFERKPLRHFS